MIELFMKQKMFSFKDAFHIYDRDEQETFKVEGRFFSLGDSLQMTDSSGKTLVSIEQKLMSLLPRYEISIGGKTVCNEAARFVSLDQLCLSPQCGFASTEEGNLLTEEQQWAKLRHVIDIANDVWR